MPKRKSKSTSTASKSQNEDGNSEDDEDVDDEAAVLWKKLQKTQRKKMKQLEAETEQLQTEKDTMAAVMTAPTNIRDDDIITINAGGKMITALRSTLIIPVDSMWSYMFSGRWEESLKRDKDGNIFFDYDSELIELIVNYLRMKKVEDPSHPLKYPHVPTHKTDDFERLVQYFGLVEFFKGPPSTMIFSKSNFVQRDGKASVTMTEQPNNTVKLVYDNPPEDGHYVVACNIELDPSGEGCFWKVNIGTNFNHYLFLGINKKLNVRNSSPGITKDYFGWGTRNRVYTNGTMHKTEYSDLDGWTSFVDGECLYFHFKLDKLSMYSVQKKKTFVIDGIAADRITAATRKFYFHTYIFYNRTSLSVAPLNVEERKVFTD